MLLIIQLGLVDCTVCTAMHCYLLLARILACKLLCDHSGGSSLLKDSLLFKLVDTCEVSQLAKLAQPFAIGKLCLCRQVGKCLTCLPSYAYTLQGLDQVFYHLTAQKTGSTIVSITGPPCLA